VEAWISLDYLQKNPTFQAFVDNYEKVKGRAFPAASAAYPAQMAAYNAESAKWQKEVGVTFQILS